MKGTVTKFVDIKPRYISFRGYSDTPMERIIKVTPLKAFPFKIKKITARNKRDLDITWRLVETDADPYYEIRVVNKKRKPGRVRNLITIHTDSTVKSKIDISVSGELKKRETAGTGQRNMIQN